MLNRGIFLIILSLLILSACGGGSYYGTTATKSGYQPGVYGNNDQGFQTPQDNDSDNRWKYVPRVQEQKSPPNFYINTRTGNTYLRIGNDENSVYVDPQGNTLMPFGEWKTDTKGNTYTPMGDWFIDSHGNALMPLN